MLTNHLFRIKFFVLALSFFSIGLTCFAADFSTQVNQRDLENAIQEVVQGAHAEVQTTDNPEEKEEIHINQLLPGSGVDVAIQATDDNESITIKQLLFMLLAIPKNAVKFVLDQTAKELRTVALRLENPPLLVKRTLFVLTFLAIGALINQNVLNNGLQDMSWISFLGENTQLSSTLFQLLGLTKIYDLCPCLMNKTNSVFQCVVKNTRFFFPWVANKMNSWIPWAAKGSVNILLAGLLVNPLVDVSEKGCGALFSWCGRKLGLVS